MSAVLDAVRQETASQPDAVVRRVHVRAGALRQLEPETLRFCYRSAVTGTPWEGSELCLEVVPAVADCRACRREFPVEEQWFVCPHCGDTAARLLRGKELFLAGIELDSVPLLAG